jgi:Helix-turn-helix domain
MKKGKEKMLTVSEVAARLGESERNIRNWAKQKVFPGAELRDSPRGPYWEIPESDLQHFEKPARGRPPKPKPKTSKKRRKG